MHSVFTDVLNGRESNYLLPFYWQHGGHTEKIPQQVEEILQSGCRAICVEARPHKDFGGESWWQDMEILLSECKKREMKLWLLDDDHFPTGHANGLISKKYPHLRPWLLIERHLDVVGPMQSATVFVPPEDEENILLGAFAYPRCADDAECCFDEGIDLTEQIANHTLLWDIPEGVWRIFFYYRSRQGGNKDYIDVINPQSVDVLLEAVYEPHWEHFREHFGNTFVGFFSDEPGFKNNYQGRKRMDAGVYEVRIGRQALALPYNDEVRSRLQETLGFDPLPHLHLLWYEGADGMATASKLRNAYMDTITHMYRTHFCKRIGDWCHAHGVEYIGHVIEDNGCHARMRYGAGHYFRSLDGQDMAGMDIVLHQVMPGMSDLTHSASLSMGASDGVFFHYTLGKLCASLAHLHPAMRGRAMCEVFGAFGWSEGTPFMKWLIDFLLVRGINHFVPHAFSPDFPDPDCPPHFGAQGHDPTFEAFGELCRYTNRAAHLLYGGTHVANAALLYHAELEWANRPSDSMPVDAPAKALLDAHIDYDIVPMDYLKDARVEENKLLLGNERFDCLIVPACRYLPVHFEEALASLGKQGLPLFFVDSLPVNVRTAFACLPLGDLAAHIRSLGMADVWVPDGFPKLRIYHVRRQSSDVFLLFNEDFAKCARTTITLPVCGSFVRADLLTKQYSGDVTEDGSVEIDLAPGESLFLLFGEETVFPPKVPLLHERSLSPTFSLALADYRSPRHFEEKGSFDCFFNVTSPQHLPDFSGKMRYRFTFRAEKATHAELDLGTVGESAALTLNGIPLGMRISPPYRFDVSAALREGENEVEITVSNHLGYALRDSFSYLMQNAPSGLLGGMKFRYT